jgi:flagellar protein FlaJ
MAKKKKGFKNLPYLEQFRHLKEYLTLAGIKTEVTRIYALLFFITTFLDLAILFYIIYLVSGYEIQFIFVILIAFVMLTLVYVLLFLMVWLGFLLVIDYLKFKRRSALEEVLPEFLRLVSTNHRSGLPLDVSLWKANKPRFGILSEEINEVAKKTYATGDLVQPFEEFGKKYDSNMLKRVITNLLEGVKTGADIAGLLDEISTNITTIRNTRKELASEVENYMLFITITVLVISPFMFGLTNKMSGLIESVKNTLSESMGSGGEVAGTMPMDISFEKSEKDFKQYFDYFVYLMLLTNSVISVLLMSLVKYGNVQQDLKRIPIYYVIAMIVYLSSKALFANFLVL